MNTIPSQAGGLRKAQLSRQFELAPEAHSAAYLKLHTFNIIQYVSNTTKLEMT